VRRLLRLKCEGQVVEALSSALAWAREARRRQLGGMPDEGQQQGQQECKPPGRGRLVVVHVRRGDQPELSTHSAAAAAAAVAAASAEGPPALREAPPFEEGEGDSWDGQGAGWRCPAAWLAAALWGLALDGAASDVLWVCTDDVGLSRQPAALLSQLGLEAAADSTAGGGDNAGSSGISSAMQPHAAGAWAPPAVLSWDAVLAEARKEPSLAARLAGQPFFKGWVSTGGGSEGSSGEDSFGKAAVIADWLTMAAADVLLCSNSTLSFAAAMASRQGAGGGAFLRPDPRVGAFVPFDPWDALPLLPARGSLPANHSIHRHT
jgi:hypothetical protein